MYDISFTQNRELSWLKFNERVLEEAQDNKVPLLERIKFLSIFDSNLDEFFMVRVGSLTDLSLLKKKVIDNKSLMDQDQQLDAIMQDVADLYQKKDHIYQELREKFRSIGMFSVELAELNEHELEFVHYYFENTVIPLLNYQVVDMTHPFPHIPNLGMFSLFVLKSKEDEKRSMGIIQIPDKLNRYLKLSENKIILLESIILEFGKALFENYNVEETYNLSLTRNADISYDDDDIELEEDYRSLMKKMLKKRKRLTPVRLEIDRNPSQEVEEFLLSNLGLTKNRLFITKSPVRMSYLFAIAGNIDEIIAREHSDKPFSPQPSPHIDMTKPIMAQIEEKDRILSYPYESMDPVIELLKEAAEDEDVVSIKITLYRIAEDSRVAKQLIAAAENGKDVVVLMELRARFDEENNILWSSNLEKAGCRVIYGYDRFKCHSKVLLITKLKDNKVAYITQVATGNYNEKTAKLYTDFSLLTANHAIGNDALILFENFLTGEVNGSYDKLMVSPKSMQEGLDRLFEEQIQKAREGGDGYIRLKMNSISDRILIDKISEASNAGVKIDMMVRGICCIIPGIIGKTENLRVFSVVGRFLEHHRIYQFGRGPEAQVYISSADFMTRNIRKRVEVACPLLDPDIKERVLEFLDIMFSDDVKIRELLPSKRYALVERKNNLIAQEVLIQRALEGKKTPEKKVEEREVRPLGSTKEKKEEVKESKAQTGFFASLWKKIFG